jgi:hypothetical protein
MKRLLAAFLLAAATLAAGQPATEPSEEPTTQPSEPAPSASPGPAASAADVPDEPNDAPTTEPSEEQPADSPTTQPSEEPAPDDSSTESPQNTTPDASPAETPSDPPPEREVGEFDASSRYKLPFKLTLDGWQIIADSRNERFTRILFQPTRAKKEEMGVGMAALIIGAQRLSPGDVLTRKEFAIFEEGYIAGRKAKAPDAKFEETEDPDDVEGVPRRRGTLSYGAEEEGGDPKYKSHHVLFLTKNAAIVIAMDGDADKGDEIKAELERLLESFEWTSPAEELTDGEN